MQFLLIVALLGEGVNETRVANLASDKTCEI